MNPYIFKAELLRVVDGDTIRVNVDLGMGIWEHNVSLRLLGVDTPERGKTDFFTATNDLRAYLYEHHYSGALTVPRKLTISTFKKDSFGRWLAVVFVDMDGVRANVNEGMRLRWGTWTRK